MVKEILAFILFLNLSLELCSSMSFVNDSIHSSEDIYSKNAKEQTELVENEKGEFEIVEVDLTEEDDIASADSHSESDEVNRDVTAMNSALHKIGQKYYCTAEVPDESYLLMYGTKTWKFPQQQVNLTLTYPSEHDETNIDAYLITEFELLVYINGGRTRAYLTSGAIMRDTLSLLIVSEDISYLSYQFSVYGIAKATFFRKGRFRYHCG